MDCEQDANYLALPDTLKQLIDAAFDSVLSTDALETTRDDPPYKRRRIADQVTEADSGGFLVENQNIEPGGFIIDDTPAPGGFLPPSQSPPTPSSQLPPQHTRIPLSLIPSALARLNLSPDDEDVLAVFRNAAFGWSRSHQASPQDHSQKEGVVSRNDFRAVCAVLLDSGSPPSPTSHSSISVVPIAEGGGFIPTTASAAASDLSVSRNPDFALDDSGEDSDAYQEPDSDPADDDDSSDEYMEGRRPGPSSRPSKSARMPRGTMSSDNETDGSSHKPKMLSSRQKKESRLAFGLFFPDVADNKLNEQRIMIRDIIRVAGLLKEKIKAEEITEMLAAFSTSPDGSMSLTDFERMMVVAGMV